MLSWDFAYIEHPNNSIRQRGNFFIATGITSSLSKKGFFSEELVNMMLRDMEMRNNKYIKISRICFSHHKSIKGIGCCRYGALSYTFYQIRTGYNTIPCSMWC